MARLFISHSSVNNAAAVALRDWLFEQGFENEVFLDIDPDRGVAPGERWQEALKAAADRCEAVLFLVSPAWLASRWCRNEFDLARLLHKRIFGLIVEPVPFEQLPTEMTAEWQLCELTGEDRFRGFDVEVLGKAERVEFREAGLDLLRRGIERAGLDARSFPWPPRDEPGRAPYRGLKALEPQDAAIFFGRDAWIVRGLDSIRGIAGRGTEKMLVILGASGSGKSSFLRAGLWPRLLRDDANFLPLPVIRPQTAAISGSTGLAVSLAGAFERLGAARPPGRIKEALGSGADAFGYLLDELLGLAKRRLVAIEDDPAIVLSLDQAEELFNPDGSVEAAAFLDLLAGVLVSTEGTSARRLLVVATMRSDRYELLQAEPHLEAVKQDLFNLPPLPPAEFKSVIEGPAYRLVEAGGRLAIDPALTERLIANAQGADALPLLGFTLERLYADYGGEGHLTLADYEQLGGVQGSLEAAVADALAEPGRTPAIPPDRDTQLAALRAAFIPWLARIDPESGAPMRRVARRNEIPEASRAIVERLVEARLLVTDRRDGSDVVEIAHESLLRQWQTLTDWLEDAAAELKLIEGVERAAADWNANAKAEIWLDHRGDRLRDARQLVAQDAYRQRLGETDLAYLAACHDREETERREREVAQARALKLQRRVLSAVTVGFVAALVLAGLAGWQWRVAQAQQTLAEAQTKEAERQRVEAQLSQSRFLTPRALEALAAGQPELASLIARAALPADMTKPDRRLWFPAVSALTQARDADLQRVIMPGHTGPVSSAAWSPDGARIVTASADSTARVWDAKTGAQLALLQMEPSLLTNTGSAAWSPDGARIVTASEDSTARVWDAKSGAQLALLEGHTSGVLSAAWSPDGTRIVTASEDSTARVWDAKTGAQLALLQGLTFLVVSAAWSPDGARIVTAASGDNSARVWDAKTGAQLALLQGHTEAVSGAAWSPDGGASSLPPGTTPRGCGPHGPC